MKPTLGKGWGHEVERAWLDFLGALLFDEERAVCAVFAPRQGALARQG